MDIVIDKSIECQHGKTRGYLMIVRCSLCGIELPDEAPRLSRHNEWHSKAWVQHRNTTQGIPEWSIVNDQI